MYEYRGIVERVVDGDTVDVHIDLGFDVWVVQRLRIAHIDAPESYEPGGRAATQYVQSLLPVGKWVTVRTMKADKYGRYLADLEVEPGVDLAQQLLASGHALPYEGGTRS